MDFDKLVERINQLARKKKGEGLTSAEEKEQMKLRKEYLRRFRPNMAAQLDNVLIKEPDGSLRKLKKKDKDHE